MISIHKLKKLTNQKFKNLIQKLFRFSFSIFLLFEPNFFLIFFLGLNSVFENSQIFNPDFKISIFPEFSLDIYIYIFK